VIAAFFTGSIMLGVIALCIGAVLRMDYEEKKHGLQLMVMGIISGLSGPVLGWFIIWNMDHPF
jgi:cytochrome bd-type quinol oxidase subunit 1